MRMPSCVHSLVRPLWLRLNGMGFRWALAFPSFEKVSSLKYLKPALPLLIILSVFIAFNVNAQQQYNALMAEIDGRTYNLIENAQLNTDGYELAQGDEEAAFTLSFRRKTKNWEASVLGLMPWLLF